MLAGAASAEISPPLDVGYLVSSIEGRWAPFSGKRTPLMARSLLLQDDNSTIALVSLDLIGLTDASTGGWDNFKNAIAAGAGVAGLCADHIIIHCTHTHSAPESISLTSLEETPAFRDWISYVTAQISMAIKSAWNNRLSCQVDWNRDELPGYTLQRRIPGPNGIGLSDAMQPVSPELMVRHPIDRRITAIRFTTADGMAIATLVHAVCHPVHEMCSPVISPDFPGEMCALLERQGDFGIPLFLNGAAGDINPTTVMGGPATAREHGSALAETVSNLLLSSEPDTASGICCPLAFKVYKLDLPVRPFTSRVPVQPCIARMAIVRIGALCLIFLPGEPFVQTALDIEQESPFPYTIVSGYTENSVGYIPPEQVFNEGGYETGPGMWSYAGQISESMLRRAVVDLLNDIRL